jgi:integrase/recombinase XerD
MVSTSGQLAAAIELRDWAAKKTAAAIPLHGDLAAALGSWMIETSSAGPVIRSERRPDDCAQHRQLVQDCLSERGLAGCTSHSGRSTSTTRAARLVHKAGGSLRGLNCSPATDRSRQLRYIDGIPKPKGDWSR